MKYTLIASLLTCAVYASPIAQVQNGQATQVQGGNVNGQPTQQQGAQGAQGVNQPVSGPQTGTGAGIANGQTPTTNDLATAVTNWMADTSMVSSFLNTGASIQNNVQFKQAALVAYNAEVDELNHKAIIDAANSAMPSVIGANATLATGGSFQDVVDKLQIMSVQGMAAANNIDLINQNRCVNVLPNIDAYMASTGQPGAAVRPTACDNTGVIGGVQGTGPTQAGAPAGSPAAAFAAAAAQAAGGSPLVQNGATQGAAGAAAPQTTTPQQGQQQAGAVQGQTPQQGQQIQNGQATAQQGQAGQQTAQQGQQTGQQTAQQGQQTAQQGQQTAQQGQQTAQQGQQIQQNGQAAGANTAQQGQNAGAAAQGQQQAGNGVQNAGAATQ